MAATAPEPLERLNIEVSAHPDLALADLAARYKYNPLGFVKVAFPWGEAGTVLADYEGPCPCQIQILTELTKAVQSRKFDGKHPVRPIRIAVCSGHGIGKSACIGMIVTWILVCWPHSQGSATANTATQLGTKTWANIRKWLKLSVFAHWFEATSELVYRHGERDEWFLGAQTSSEDNSEAFAGQHAANAISFYINDECSTIPDKIFEVEDGGMTDGMPIQLLFGNPTVPLGKFARAMKGQEPGDWIKIRIDSRDCPFTNKDEIAEWIEAYGEDSDFVRVRVRGLPPRAAASQFISDDLVMDAIRRVPRSMFDDPLIAGCDFAWGGDDNNTVRFRKGADARSIPPIYVPGELTRKPDVMVQVLSEVLSKTYSIGPWSGKVAMLFMDSAGIAGPVAMRLRELNFKNLIEVNFMGHSADVKYKNTRAMMIGRAKEWLSNGSIDRSSGLQEDCQAIKVLKHVPLLLIPKEEIIKEIGHSTDDLDALALTFYAPVKPVSVEEERARKRRANSDVGAWA